MHPAPPVRPPDPVPGDRRGALLVAAVLTWLGVGMGGLAVLSVLFAYGTRNAPEATGSAVSVLAALLDAAVTVGSTAVAAVVYLTCRARRRAAVVGTVAVVMAAATGGWLVVLLGH